MEKSNAKVYAVIALVVAVVALSIGFAAFSATLTIENASATVKANDEFSANVNYVSGSPKCYYTGDTNKTAVTNAVAGTASGKTWTGVSVPLTAGHYSVTCEAEILNESNYIAYLKSISANGSLTCASVGSGDSAATNISTICNNTTATVSLDSKPAEVATFTNGTNSAFTSTTSSIAASTGTDTVYLTIAYAGSVAADGDITVTIPTISLLYKTAQ